MRYDFPDYAIAYVVASLFSFITASMTWRRRSNPGNVPFTLLMFSLCIWSFASIFEAGAVSSGNKFFWSKWQYIGIASLPPLWLYFTAEFTNQKLFREHLRWIILIIPAITLLLAFTNEYHHLLWSNIILQPGLLNIAIYEHGPWFYVHVIYSYLLLFIGTYWLIVGLLNYPRQKRRQIIIIFAGLVIGWVSNILYILGLFPIPGLDITPLSFTFIALVLSWNIFQFRLFDIVPIARDLLLDNMSDGVIVLDPDDVIIDINPAAIKLLEHEKMRSPLGHSIWDVYDSYYPILHDLKHKTDFQTELQVGEDPPQYISLTVSSIYDQNHHFVGRVLTFRDITKRKLIEIRESDQRKLAEALADTAAVINSTLNLDEVLENILENVGKVVPHDTANIALLDDNKRVRFVRIRGYEKYGTENIVPTIEVGVDEIPNLKRMAETGKASINPDTDADPEWDRTMPGSGWIKSYMGAPIIGKGQVLGFVNLDAATPNFFKEEYVPRLQAFANQAAIAIENAQFFKETSESANKMAILYEVGVATTTGLGLEKTSKALFEQLLKVVPIDLFYIAILDPSEEIVKFSMFQGDGTQLFFNPISIRDRPSLTRYVLEKRKTVYIPDSLDKNSEYPHKKMVRAPGHDERSILGIPLVLRNEVHGALFLQAKQPYAYGEDQISLIEMIANQASVAIDNSRLFEKIQNMAITDALTGIYNRRYFYEYAENEIIRSLRYQSEMSLIMIDIDRFKLVNDKFGHLIGDQTLKMVADTCLSVLRKVDVLCRFGGEEFIVLLPETSKKDATIAAERIRQAIAEQSVPTDTAKGPVSITVSIGVTQLKGKEETLKHLIDQADQALYAAKESGRNRVCVF